MVAPSAVPDVQTMAETDGVSRGPGDPNGANAWGASSSERITAAHSKWLDLTPLMNCGLEREMSLRFDKRLGGSH
jgi:hypothetical protein